MKNQPERLSVYELNRLILKLIREQIEIAKKDLNYQKIQQLNNLYYYFNKHLNGE